MGKLLRVLVVILLLLGIAAFGLGYILFQKRETLKGHVQDLATQVVNLAPYIEASQDPNLAKGGNPTMAKDLSVTQLLTYKLDPTVTLVDTNRPATMDAAMKDLIGKANVQFTILNDTRAALAQKITELDTATNKIAALEADIVKLEGEKKALQETITGLEKDVAERKAKIEQLTADIETANSKVTDLQESVAKLKDTIGDRDDTIKTLNETIARITRANVSTNGPTGALTQGTKGKILLVNKDYNFVVLGISDVRGVGVGVELTIQRGEKLVGKVKISDFNEQYSIAIADQLTGAIKQDDAEVGDHVFY